MQRHKDVKEPGYTFDTFWEHMSRAHTAGKSLSFGMWPLVMGIESELGRRRTWVNGVGHGWGQRQ